MFAAAAQKQQQWEHVIGKLWHTADQSDAGISILDKLASFDFDCSIIRILVAIVIINSLSIIFQLVCRKQWVLLHHETHMILFFLLIRGLKAFEGGDFLFIFHVRPDKTR